MRKRRKTKRGREYAFRYNRSASKKRVIKKYRESPRVKEYYRLRSLAFYWSPKGQKYVKRYRISSQYRALNKKWRKSKTGRIITATIKANYRSKVKRISSRDMAEVLRRNILQFGRATCYLCKKRVPISRAHIDHKIPVSRGGMNTISNLELACAYCNRSKKNKTHSEYLKWKRG
jgi:5-methylcytosine-specific restriction endonuclease McrA